MAERDQYDEKAEQAFPRKWFDVHDDRSSREAVAALLRRLCTEAEERGRQQAIEAVANAGAEHGIIDAIRAIGPSTTDTSAEQRGYERARREAVEQCGRVRAGVEYRRAAIAGDSARSVTERGLHATAIAAVDACIAAINAIGTTKEEG